MTEKAQVDNFETRRKILASNRWDTPPKKKKIRAKRKMSLIYNTNQFTNYPYIRRVEQTRVPVYESGPILNVLKSKNEDYDNIMKIKPVFEQSDSESDYDSIEWNIK